MVKKEVKFNLRIAGIPRSVECNTPQSLTGLEQLKQLYSGDLPREVWCLWLEEHCTGSGEVAGRARTNLEGSDLLWWFDVVKRRRKEQYGCCDPRGPDEHGTCRRLGRCEMFDRVCQLIAAMQPQQRSEDELARIYENGGSDNATEGDFDADH